MDSSISSGGGTYLGRGKYCATALLMCSSIEVPSVVSTWVPFRCSDPQIYLIGRKEESGASSFADVGSRRCGSAVMSTAPIVDMLRKSVCPVVRSALGGCGVSLLRPKGNFRRRPPILLRR